MPTQKTKFLFDHIPKTAGTSLHFAFRELFPGYTGNPIFSSHYHLLQQVDANYIGGHIHFNVGEALSQEHYYCAVLRDPVQRFVSEYFFHRQMGNELLAKGALNDPMLRDWQVLNSMRLELEQFLELGSLAVRYFTNIQSHHFAARLSSNTYELDSDALADAAIASLEGYDLVGSFDNLQGFVNAIADEFEISQVLLEKLKVTRGDREREKLSKRAQTIIAEANAADYRMLHWASQRFGWESGPRSPRPATNPIERVVGNSSEELIETSETNPSFGNKLIQIVETKCYGELSGAVVVDVGEAIIVDVNIEATVAENDITVGIAIRDREGRLVYGVNTFLLGLSLSIPRPGRYNVQAKLRNHLGSGAHSVTLALHKDRSHTAGCYHWIDSAASFAVNALRQPYEGYVDCQAAITFKHV